MFHSPLYGVTLIASMLALVSIDGAVATAQATRVATYNIRLDVASDGEHAWPQRRAALATFVGTLDADILGLQEALPHQVAYLDSALAGHGMYTQPRDGEAGGEACTIFYRSDRYTLDTAGTFWLSPTPDTPSFGWNSCCRRICSWARVRTRSSAAAADSVFYVFNAHLDHQYPAARINGLRIVLEHVERLNATGQPVVLLGDFNALPESAEVQQLGGEFVDAYERSGEVNRVGPVGTFSGFGLRAEAPARRIDYVWLSRGDAPPGMRYAALTAIAGAGYVSDHYAVLVEW